MVVNFTGSFAIGVLAVLSKAHVALFQPETWPLAVAGFLGSYTTVSSFSLQTLALAQDREWMRAVGNIVLSIVLCLSAAVAGMACAQAVLTLSDADVLRIPACFMAETLEAGSAVVEAVGNHLAVDASQHWQPDDTFFDLIRDKAVINAMLAEVADKPVADANVAEKAKTQKKIIRDCLDGANGRAKAEGWLLGWMAFPVCPCTGSGTLGTAEAWARVRNLFAAE